MIMDRLRYAAPDRVPQSVYAAAAPEGRYIAAAPVLMEGRLELLHYLINQSICHAYHRYGNLGVRAIEARMSGRLGHRPDQRGRFSPQKKLNPEQIRGGGARYRFYGSSFYTLPEIRWRLRKLLPKTKSRNPSTLYAAIKVILARGPFRSLGPPGVVPASGHGFQPNGSSYRHRFGRPGSGCMIQPYSPAPVQVPDKSPKGRKKIHRLGTPGRRIDISALLDGKKAAGMGPVAIYAAAFGTQKDTHGLSGVSAIRSMNLWEEVAVAQNDVDILVDEFHRPGFPILSSDEPHHRDRETGSNYGNTGIKTGHTGMTIEIESVIGGQLIGGSLFGI